MNDLWLFIEHGKNGTWTRAEVPQGPKNIRELVSYIQHGGRVLSLWLELPDRARYIPRVAGMTVIARLAE